MAEGIELGKAYVQIIPSAKGIKGKIASEIDGEAESAGKSGGGHLLASMGKTIAAGAAVVAGAAAALVSQSVKQFAEYEQLAGGAQLMYGDAYDFIAEKAQNAYKTVQMSQSEYLNQANGFAVGLTNALGGNAQAAAELADKILTAEADIVAATGRDAEAIQNAFNGIMRGNFTMLDNLGLGIAGTRAGMEQVIEAVNAQKEANGEATRYQMDNLADMQAALVDYVEMQGLAGYASKEAGDTITGSLASVKAAWANTLVAMADDNGDFEGSVNALSESATGFISNIIPRIEVALKALPALVGAIAPIIINELPRLIAELLPEVVNVITGLISSLVTVLPDLINTLVPAVLDAVLLLITTLVPMLPEIINTLVPALIDGAILVVNTLVAELPNILTMVVTALIDALPAIIEGAITLFMGIIQAIPVVIDELLVALPDIIDMLINFLIENIPVLIDGAIQLFMAIVQAIPVIIQSLITNLPRILTTIISGLGRLGSMLWSDVLQPALSKVGEWISNMASKALEVGRTFLNNVISFFKELPTNVYNWLLNTISKVTSWGKDLGKKLLEIGGNAVKGLWNGINNMIDWVVEKIKGLGNTILGAIKWVLGIHSPSTEFAWIGQMLDEGLAEGITDNLGSVVNAVEDIADVTAGTLQSEIAVAGSMDYSGFSDSTPGTPIAQLITAVDRISARLDNLQIVLDSGALVGGISEQMDGALGDMQAQVKRGLLA